MEIIVGIIKTSSFCDFCFFRERGARQNGNLESIMKGISKCDRSGLFGERSTWESMKVMMFATVRSGRVTSESKVSFLHCKD